MAAFSKLTALLRDTLLQPRVPAEELEATLRTLQSELPAPVLWLLGKTQAGKTSLIRTLTGATDAEIGDGFRPCTQFSRLYPFPNEDSCLLRFLDTRGLGEHAYDPEDDLRQFATQAHLIVVVVRAMDRALEPVLTPLREIHRQHPEWPVLVVQTTLHEGYPSPFTNHVQPYPYEGSNWPDFPELNQALRQQRELFQKFPVRFVAVDLTLPEDGYVPEHYGEEALWQALKELMPGGFLALLRQETESGQTLDELYQRKAHPHIIAYSLLAGGAGAVPFPLVGVPLVASLQAKLLQTIASIYGQPLNRQRLLELTSGLGAGVALSTGGRELAKLIPGFGSVVGGLSAAASTYALGKTLGLWFKRRGQNEDIGKSVLRQIYAEQLAAGRALLEEQLRTPKP